MILSSWRETVQTRFLHYLRCKRTPIELQTPWPSSGLQFSRLYAERDDELNLLPFSFQLGMASYWTKKSLRGITLHLKNNSSRPRERRWTWSLALFFPTGDGLILNEKPLREASWIILHLKNNNSRPRYLSETGTRTFLFPRPCGSGLWIKAGWIFSGSKYAAQEQRVFTPEPVIDYGCFITWPSYFKNKGQLQHLWSVSKACSCIPLRIHIYMFWTIYWSLPRISYSTG